MKSILWTALFLTGALLAACTRQNSPLVLAAQAAAEARTGACAPAKEAAQDGELCYLAWNGKNAFVLHVVDKATGRDTPVAMTSGSAGTDGSRTARLERDGRVFLGRAQA